MYTDLTFSPHTSFGMGIKLALNFIWNGIKKALKSLEFHLEDPGGTLITHSVCIIRFRPVGVVAQAHIAVGHYCQAGRHGSQGSHSRRLLLLSQSAW